ARIDERKRRTACGDGVAARRTRPGRGDCRGNARGEGGVNDSASRRAGRANSRVELDFARRVDARGELAVEELLAVERRAVRDPVDLLVQLQHFLADARAGV